MARAIDYSQGGSFMGGVNEGLTTGLRVMQAYQAGKQLKDQRKKEGAIQDAAAATPTEEVGREQAMAGAKAAYENALAAAGDDPAKRAQVEAEYAPVFSGVQATTPETPRYRLGDVVANQPLSPDQLSDAKLGLQQQNLAAAGLSEDALKVGHERQAMRGNRLQQQVAQHGLNKAVLEQSVNDEITKINASDLPPEVKASRSAAAYSRIDPIKAAGLEKASLDLAKEHMSSTVYKAYGVGGIEGVIKEYNAFPDGIQATMARDDKGNAVITVIDEKTGKPLREDTIAGTPEAEQAYIARVMSAVDPKLYLQSLQFGETMSNNKKTRDEAERHNKASEGIAAKNADARVTAAEAKALAAEAAAAAKANKPAAGDLKPKDGLSTIQQHFGGRFEGGTYFPDEANKSVALRAQELLEEKLADGGTPMASAKRAIEQAEREKATGTLPVGKAPAAAEASKPGGTYRSLWQ